jgi:hypothetical protein
MGSNTLNLGSNGAKRCLSTQKQKRASDLLKAQPLPKVRALKGVLKLCKDPF